ncbi:unnamed protein product [Paramecium octaurelia]|uniref:Uncharacterized protein n=1 Tax=Paramecium octaurelia TaxID=43137 RepID=A0A8S1SJ77_PAROT|nr:unnamed protein product [Paramecium octaurelia]
MPIQEEILNELLYKQIKNFVVIKKNVIKQSKLGIIGKSIKIKIKRALFKQIQKQIRVIYKSQRVITKFNHLVKPEMLKARMITENQKVLTAQLINKITQKQLEQENFCVFPQITQKNTKKRSKTEQHQNNQYNKQQKALARTAYLIVL